MLLSPVPEDAFTMQLLYLKLRDPGKSVAWSEGWGTVRIWGTEFAWGHSLGMSEATCFNCINLTAFIKVEQVKQ